MNKSTIENDFKNFAEKRLYNHLEEINTRYQNERPDTDLRREAANAHRKIFEEELNKKIKELGSGNRDEIEKFKSTYLEQLK